MDRVQQLNRHPAKYTDSFISIFAKELSTCKNVLDPFAGVGKIGLIKNYGYTGEVYANEIESEWLRNNVYDCDFLTFQDAEFLEYTYNFFDAICTSPTYGNRMADHHTASDGSQRNTYTHCLGHKLSIGNTGAMQWGKDYKEKHQRIYTHLVDLLKPNGIFIVNVSDHIRKGEIINVSDFHLHTLLNLGLVCEQSLKMPTKRLKYGANSDLRCGYENIFVLKKYSG